ncbi:hypothetical protein BI49514_02561 [Brevibacterium iodinum ATCC 49514]|uniref:Uncharacterized protein n=1 Tax=Brevibacterium iodinum ATCC 49514 TaxID=1255616 RepID=A0A2H1K0X1_9MICO|nr:hypothetical protein [Brevibacterium iodinum]SMX93204.1 hypothetical protein BI49514_02561 [Brevibacterium iodinum ATCC 49514]SUW12958.1 Uncharacterised protein [Brevibacterium iodinum]
MGAFAIIPAAPVLLENIDHTEAARMAELRTVISDLLRTQTTWSLPVNALPPLAGLGGWGIDRGFDTRTGQLITGDDWITAVASLTEDERELAEAADPAVIVALLHAHAAGVEVGPLGTSENLLLPIDLSAAAAESAPLAPIGGAAGFDAEIVESLTSGGAAQSGSTIDISRLSDLCSRAAGVHANLTMLDNGLRHISEQGASLTSPEITVDERVHDVRSLCGIGTWA